MTARLVLYTIFAALLAGLTLLSSFYAWSPYSDEDHHPHGAVYVRPMHK
ncbi:hypothetical protein MTR62_16085 [Novosphingobium sp. 1949]|uniref:Uncharacterized protein n=1 Tax=Novosphingobium organovorum TaxID=2930092 RepID=A0ABT0BHJ8_9SPHN|nr:hypothetical protein [Novosphingobium organovorum]MCJ2184199.1 hypothetical protein [Novosphingobium organovorum]